MSLGKITKAGDVSIDEVSIISLNGFAQDITPQVMGIDIYEDLFGSFITGKLHVRDSQELSSLFPLIGEEIVKIKLKTPILEEKEGYIGEFFIYKMDDVIKDRDREIIYTLHFISKEAIINLNVKISRTFSGKVSDIAKTILESDWSLYSKKKLNIEDTSNSTKYISNFWDPLYNLTYLCNNAINANNSPSYLFYENKYGLNFVSLDSLYSLDATFQKFIWDNYSAEVDSLGGSSKSIERDYQRILDIRPNTHFNYMQRLKTGMYGSETITYDIVTRQYTHTAYKPDFAKYKHLNGNPLWTNVSPTLVGSNLYVVPKYYNNFDNYDDVTNAKIIGNRNSVLAQAEANKVNITVFGRTDYSVGKKVYLELPKNTQITQENSDWENKILSGYYIISAVCHNITRKQHTSVLELSKDSYMVDINDTK